MFFGIYVKSIYKNDLENPKRNIDDDDNRKETIYLLSSHCIDCYFP